MWSLRPLVLLPLVSGLLAAQQVTMVCSPALLGTEATAPGATDPRTATSIPAVVVSAAVVGAESAMARIDATSQQLAYGCSLSIQHDLSVATAGAMGTGASATADVLVQLTATMPEPVVLQFGGSLQATAGAPAPLVQIDLHDDGMVEFTGGPSSSPPLAVQLGPVPVLVRVRTEASLSLTGAVRSTVSLLLLPAHDTVPTITTFGCSSQHLYAQPTFGGGIELGVVGPPLQGPVALVLGLSVQPALLPSALPIPCLLVPSPDIVVALPAPAGLLLALPPSVRPVTFWAEAIPITALGLEATGSYRVEAH